MPELRLRDDKGQYAEEHEYMNAMFRSMAGCGQPEPKASTPAPANLGQPVPPGAGPEPREDENTIMNHRLMEMAGVTDPDSR